MALAHAFALTALRKRRKKCADSSLRTQEALLFWDEVDWAAAALTEPAACLTDHNALSAQASAHFQPASVLAVLDHHNDEQLYPAASPRHARATLATPAPHRTGPAQPK
eukprot:SAG11_NODE_203_length_12529_cov_6.036444_9_plen_109_part_00